MGGCATKPKVLNPDEAPAPPPEPVKEEAVAVKEEAVVVSEEVNDEVAKEEGGVVKKDKEINDDDIVEENGSKRRSLSHLFKENESKDSTENAQTTLEPVKQEQPSATEKAIDVSETKPIEAEKAESVVKEPTTPVFVDAPSKADIEEEAIEAVTTVKPSSQKAIEVAPTTEIAPTIEPSAEKAIDATQTLKPEMLPRETVIEEEKLATETQKPEVKNIEEEISATETQKHEVLPVEKKTEEEKVTTEIQTPEILAKEKKTEEEKPDTLEEKGKEEK